MPARLDLSQRERGFPLSLSWHCPISFWLDTGGRRNPRKTAFCSKSLATASFVFRPPDRRVRNPKMQGFRPFSVVPPKGAGVQPPYLWDSASSLRERAGVRGNETSDSELDSDKLHSALGTFNGSGLERWGSAIT